MFAHFLDHLFEKLNFREKRKMGLFGASKADPKKQVNEMQSVLRKETRNIERQIRDIVLGFFKMRQFL